MQVSLKSDKINGNEDRYTFCVISCARFLVEWEMYQTNVIEKSKYTFYVQYLFGKSCLFLDNVNYRRGGQATDDSILRRICIAC